MSKQGKAPPSAPEGLFSLRGQVALVTVVPGAAIEAIHDVGRPRELHIAVVTDD